MSSFLNSRSRSFRGLCWLMTLVMATAPSVAIRAEQANQQSPTAGESSYVLSYASAIGVLRPRQLLTSEAMQMMPIEVVSAAGQQYLGFDPVDIKQIVISASPSNLYSAIVEFTQPIDLAELSDEITGHTTPAELNGKPYLKSQQPFLPSFAAVAETKLLLAPDATLQQLLRNKEAPKGALIKRLATIGSRDDLFISVDLENLRPLIQMGLSQAVNNVPAEYQLFFELPDYLKRVELRGSLSGAGPWELTADANNSDDADRVSKLIEEAIGLYSFTAAESAASLLANNDPVVQAMGRYQQRMTPIWAEGLTPKRDGERFTLFHSDEVDENSSQLTNIAIAGVLVAMLLPAVQASREAARRSMSQNNIKNILLALLNYDSSYGKFPAHANYSADGKPLLSWRVHILPFLEEQKLYEQFRLDEPWDSEHNQKLISQMPEVFLDPSSNRNTAEGKTHYLGVKGDGLAFDGSEKGRRIANFRDGTSNTIMILQVNNQRAATWTQPDDWELDPKNTLKGLAGSMHPGIFLAGFADAHVTFIEEKIDPKVFKHMLTIAGGEVVILD